MLSAERTSLANRLLFVLIVGLFSLLLATIAAAVFLVSVGLVTEEQIGVEWILVTEFFRIFDLLSWFERAGVAAAAFALGVLALALLLRSTGVRKPRSPVHVLELDERGFVAVDSRGIETLASQAALDTPGVIDASAEVRGNGMTAPRIRVEIALLPGVNVREAGITTREAVRVTVEELIGIELRDVSVKARVLEPEAVMRAL